MNVQETTIQTERPVGQLKTNRGLLKLILLSLVTLGIYAIVFYTSVANDVNLVCSRNDGKKTMHYCLLAFIVGPLTLGIGSIVWIHRLCNRIGDELKRRDVDYAFSATDYWLWNVLGSLFVVGPFIFLHKLAEAMNLMNMDYNVNG